MRGLITWVPHGYDSSFNAVLPVGGRERGFSLAVAASHHVALVATRR